VGVGMLAARTRFVRRPGAAAARAAWLGSTRPWRARESVLGLLPLDRWLLLVVPAALLVVTRAVQTSFLSWAHVATVFCAWAVFALVIRAVVGHRSPWPVIATVGGVMVLRCIVTLLALSFAGPAGYWTVLWADPVRSAVYIAVASVLLLWVFVAAGWTLATQLGARRAVGGVLAAVGAGLAVPAAAIAITGIEPALPAWNAEVDLLARVLGLTVTLDIAPDAAWLVAGLAAILALVGLALALPYRRSAASARS